MTKHKSKKQRKAIRNRNSGTDEPRLKKRQSHDEDSYWSDWY
jgi:hypothetical protein